MSENKRAREEITAEAPPSVKVEGGDPPVEVPEPADLGAPAPKRARSDPSTAASTPSAANDDRSGPSSSPQPLECRECSAPARKKCANGLCFECCCKSDDTCQFHRREKEETDWLEGRRTISVRDYTPVRQPWIVHPETSLKHVGDTAIFFSINAFFANPKWSADVLAAEGRSLRSKELANKLYEQETRERANPLLRMSRRRRWRVIHERLLQQLNERTAET